MPGARSLARTPIAIVGLGSLYPRSRDLSDLWTNVVRARDCIEPVPADHWSTEFYGPDPAVPDKTYCRVGGFVPEIPFHPMEFGLPPNTLEVTDVLRLLSLVVARDTLRDAGSFDARRTGVILGITGANSLTQPLSARLRTPVLKEVMSACGLSQEAIAEVVEVYKKGYIPWL